MMHGAPQRQLYPSLMTMPALTPAERQTAEQAAHSRMSRGLPLVEGGAEELMRAFSARDYVAARDSIIRVREGLSLFDSGLSTHLGLGAGQPPPDVALAWFKRETGLLAPRGDPGSSPTILGLSPDHVAAMAGLAALAAWLLLLQFIRMRRVAALLRRVAVPQALAGSTLSAAKRAALARIPVPRPAPAPATLQDLPRDTVLPPPEAPPRRAWSGQLKVTHIAIETPTVKTFRLVDPSGATIPFDYLPGQFMQVEVEDPSGQKLRRAYTIASSPTRRAYVELTIRRAGSVSQHLHEHIKVGDLLKSSAPYGNFTFTGLDEDSIVFIGGGVGITPLMSAIRYLTDLAWPGEIYFIYGTRSVEEFAFREELEYLQRRHANLRVLATMDRAEGAAWTGRVGPITKEMLESAIPDLRRRRVHLCGPPPMMTAIKETLTALGLPANRIHTESFGPASLPADSLPPAPPAPATVARIAAIMPAETVAVAPTAAANTVIFARSGKSAPLPAGRTVLEAAETVGVDIPWSCRVGISGTCKVKLVEGAVTMEVEEGLSLADKAAGYILACQARSTGGNLVVDA